MFSALQKKVQSLIKKHVPGADSSQDGNAAAATEFKTFNIEDNQVTFHGKFRAEESAQASEFQE